VRVRNHPVGRFIILTLFLLLLDMYEYKFEKKYPSSIRYDLLNSSVALITKKIKNPDVIRSNYGRFKCKLARHLQEIGIRNNNSVSYDVIRNCRTI